jgi:hypothetical protein
VTEAKQAAVAGAVVFLVIMALMVLAAMAMASPIPASTPGPEAQAASLRSHDAHVSHLVEELNKTLALLDRLESGPGWEGAGPPHGLRISCFDLPWLWEDYPEWRLASSYRAASPQRPAGSDPVCEHPAGGSNLYAANGGHEIS